MSNPPESLSVDELKTSALIWCEEVRCEINNEIQELSNTINKIEHLSRNYSSDAILIKDSQYRSLRKFKNVCNHLYSYMNLLRNLESIVRPKLKVANSSKKMVRIKDANINSIIEHWKNDTTFALNSDAMKVCSSLKNIRDFLEHGMPSVTYWWQTIGYSPTESSFIFHGRGENKYATGLDPIKSYAAYKRSPALFDSELAKFYKSKETVTHGTDWIIVIPSLDELRILASSLASIEIYLKAE